MSLCSCRQRCARRVHGSSERLRSRYVFPVFPVIRPCSCAQAVSWVRVWKPSLVRMRSTWTSTVRTDRYSRAAISRLVNPLATSCATSASRRVTPGPGPPPPRPPPPFHPPPPPPPPLPPPPPP